MFYPRPDHLTARLAKQGWQLLRPFVGLAAVILVFQLYHWIEEPGRPFITYLRISFIAKQTAIVGMGALGMTVIIVSGGIDLSVGSMLALSAVVFASFLRGEPPMTVTETAPWLAGLWRAYPVWLAILLTLLVGALAGALNGVLITTLRMMPFIITLGMMMAYRGAAEWLADQSKIVIPRDRVPDWIASLMETPAPGEWPFLCNGVWLVLALGLLMAAVMRYTTFGRYTFAVGSNETAARLSGLRVNRLKIAFYATGGLFMALAGLLNFNELGNQGDPTTGVALELDIIAAVVIGGGSLSGGRGSVLGSLIGALTMTTLRSGCVYAGVSDPVQKVVIGGIIIAAVAIDQYLHRKET
jgi:ribose/xylose/arabinose/galactoside ABC-type transport system permease subunit